MGTFLSRPIYVDTKPNADTPPLRKNQTDNHQTVTTPDPKSIDILHSAYVRLDRSTFYAMAEGGNVITYNESRDQTERDRLRNLVVNDATHTGKIQADECDPHTRQSIIRDIISRIENPTNGKILLWLRGPAGIGKSSIAKSVANELDRRSSTAIVAGSFFFFRSDPHRNSLHRFIPTLAYQLAVSVESVGEKIDEAIKKDPQLLIADLQTQWRKLVIEPVNAVSNIPPAAMIIDGLDECIEQRDQQRLLDLLSLCGPQFPISFILCSRPESHLTNIFDTNPLSMLCQTPIDLASRKDRSEVQAFVISRFSAIYSRHRDTLRYYVANGVWPADHIVEEIVERADGQFLYPTTILRYIDDDDASPGSNPHEKLEVCLKQASPALSPLDALYGQIMTSSHGPDDEYMHDLLYICCLLPPGDVSINQGPFLLSGNSVFPQEVTPNINLLAALVPLDRAHCRLKLSKLHSVLNIPEHDERPIALHHTSFTDFLWDAHRSGPHYIKGLPCAQRIVGRCLWLLEAPETATVDLEEQTKQSVMHLWWCLTRFLAGRTSFTHLPSAFGNLYPQCVWSTAQMRNYYACLWQGCGNCPAGQRQSSDGLFFHDGECPLSWNGLIAVASANVLRANFLKLPFLDGDILEADDFVLVSLILLQRADLVQALSTDDLQYLRRWSRAWAEYPKQDLERSWMDGIPTLSSHAIRKRRVDLIIKFLRELPEEHRYYKLNKQNTLTWLSENFNTGARDLLVYWATIEEPEDTEDRHSWCSSAGLGGDTDRYIIPIVM